jgi:hypothetical protein
VSLEGSLETIALPDVLALLSVTAKTGELHIESSGIAGSVWFDAGRLAGFDVGKQRTAVDALFYLLRLTEGNFNFRTGTAPVNAVEPQDVAPVLEEAEGWLTEWQSIVGAVPSLESEVKLQEAVPAPVTLRPDQWQLVTSIGWGRQVGEVLQVRGLGEFEGCKAVKELVDMKLVEVIRIGGSEAANDYAADVQDAESAQERWSDAELADLSNVWGENGEQPKPEEEEQPAAEAPEPVNRGLLLKFLGSARN